MSRPTEGHVETSGEGMPRTWTIEHNLGTYDIVVSVFDPEGSMVFPPLMTQEGIDTVTLHFNEFTPAGWKVLVKA